MKFLVFLLEFIFIFIIACVPPKNYQNYKDYREEKEIAIVHANGFLLRLQQDESSSNDKYYDFLYLTEGKYLIEFILTNNFTRGAALCQLQKGKIYTIKITEKREFPKINKSFFLGECIEIEKD